MYEKYKHKWGIHFFKEAGKQFNLLVSFKKDIPLRYTQIIETEKRKHNASFNEIEAVMIHAIRGLKLSKSDEDSKLSYLSEIYANYLMSFTDPAPIKYCIQKEGLILELTDEQFGQIVEDNFFCLWFQENKIAT